MVIGSIHCILARRASLRYMLQYGLTKICLIPYHYHANTKMVFYIFFLSIKIYIGGGSEAGYLVIFPRDWREPPAENEARRGNKQRLICWQISSTKISNILIFSFEGLEFYRI